MNYVTNYNGEMPSLLVPIRTFCTASNGANCIRATKWIVRTPFELLELMTAMTQDFERLESKGMSKATTRIGPCNFSSRTLWPTTQPLPNMIGANAQEFLPAHLFLPRLDSWEEDELATKLDARNLTSVTVTRPLKLVQPWDLSFLMHHDRDGHGELEVIRSMAHYLENNLHLKVVDLYLRLRRDVQDQVEFVTKHSTIPTEPRRRMLFKVYHQTIDKMDALIKFSQRSDLSRGHVKRDLTTYMTRWLLVNWINPYPDDEMLGTLANACDVNVQVINNWLINARTRRWRPAIQRAYQMGRPAQFLYEDSKQIFAEESVRHIPHYQPIPTPRRHISKIQGTKRRAPCFSVKEITNASCSQRLSTEYNNQSQYSPASALMIDFVTDLNNAPRNQEFKKFKHCDIIQV